MATSWSNLHTAKFVQPPVPSPQYPPQASGSGSGKKSSQARAKLAAMSMSVPPTPMREVPDPILSHGSVKKNSKNTSVDFDMGIGMDSPSLFASRSSSLAGRKRPRESTESSPASQASRRTKSVGDTRPRQGSSSSKDRDREAFQRGLIAVFVPKALKDSAKGEMGNYNDLLAHFLPTPTNPSPALATLLPLLRAISAHVSLLKSEVHGALVSAIVGLPWAHGDERFVKTFVGWAGVLVSAHPGWTKEVVQMAIKGLAWQHPTRSEIPTPRKVFHARHHLLISHLLSLIPTLPNLLGPILVKKFPHKREVEVVQTTWVRNMCELIGYCPELGARIWSEVVDRMLRIDVEINNNLEEEEDDEEDEDEDDIAPMFSSTTLDPFDLLTSQDVPKEASNEDDDSDDGSDVDPGDVSSADGDRTDEEDTQDEMKLLNQAEKKRQAVKTMREKLDGMLFYFFRHLQECMGDGESIQSAAEMAAERLGNGVSSGQSTPTSEITQFHTSVPTIASRPTPTPAQSLAHFQTLLNLFSRQILPTSSTQHIPFLLFLCSSFSHAHTDLFLGLLVSQALYASTTASPSAAAQPVSQAQRIAATVYIGSVVCRARFVTDESARQVLTYLLAYIDGKLQQSHLTKRIDELPLFYAVCQAVMLIFCFRWRAFTTDQKDGELLGEMELESEGEVEVDGEGDGKWIRDLDVLQRAITSDLNPLLGCNTTVVNTFAKVAHHTNFAYCFSIIEANQQSTTRSTSSHSLTTQANGSTPSLNRQPSTRQNSTSATYSIPRKARQSNIDAGLDSYYPFDPFTLPRSKQFIDTLYRTWGEVSIPLDESESEDEDEEEEEEDSDEDMILENTHSLSRTKPMSLPKGSSWNEARRRLGKDEGLSSSLEGMSISPAQAGYFKRH